MFNRFIILISIATGKIGMLFNIISQRLTSKNERSKILQKGSDRNLYKTKFGELYWLNSTGCVDESIINSGIFEPWSTQVVKSLVRRGDIVLDVGANIGYYSVLLSRLVGDQGKVISFEPTDHYGKVLEMNIRANSLENVEIIKVGLSNKQQELDIQIGQSSATLHVPGNQKLMSSEKVKLITLDDFLEEHPLPKIDFIKIDVDGHEPLFFEGAWKTLEKFEPTVLLEVNHLNYLSAGYMAWDFYDLLKDKGYHIYYEDGLVEILSREDFLIKCGNFAYSANIVIAKNKFIKQNCFDLDSYACVLLIYHTFILLF
jgi:FkbM family methyltransferase